MIADLRFEMWDVEMWDSPSASCTPWHADLSRRSINEGGSHEAKVAVLLPLAVFFVNPQSEIRNLQSFFFLDIHNVALLF